jgi:linoleoyl-CoA desaturase
MNYFLSTNHKSPFISVLIQRINEYFITKKFSDKGNWKMTLKIIIAALWWSISYLFLFLFRWTESQFFLIYFLNGLSQGYIVLNIAHDANHYAISKRGIINKVLSYSFDICGINSYVWRILHHKGHHFCINIQGEDETFFTRGFFRFSPHRKKKFFHKYQHLYVFFIYGFLTLDWIFTKDIEHFFFSNFKPSKETKHSISELLKFILGKVFYITYMIILPIFVLGFSPLFILSAFLVTHFIVGLACSFILQIVHPIESAQFPTSKTEFKHFIYHVFATTADYSTESPFAIWFFGGLNLHVIHHIRPGICHVHFPELTKIIRSTAKEYNVEYRENKRMTQAIIRHWSCLKKMGNTE